MDIFNNIKHVEIIKERKIGKEWETFIEVTFFDEMHAPRAGNGKNGLSDLILSILTKHPQFVIDPTLSGAGNYTDTDGVEREYSIQFYVNRGG